MQIVIQNSSYQYQNSCSYLICCFIVPAVGADIDHLLGYDKEARMRSLNFEAKRTETCLSSSH